MGGIWSKLLGRESFRLTGPRIKPRSIVDTSPYSDARELSDIKRYQVIEEYTIAEPYPHIRILFDTQESERIYQVIEPQLTPKETEYTKQIENIIRGAIDIRLDTLKKGMMESKFKVTMTDLDDAPYKILRTAVKDSVKAYKMDLNKTNTKKIEYFILRDFLGFGRIDAPMNDPNIEDISYPKPGVDAHMYHRSYLSLRSNIRWDSEDELDAFAIRLAQRSGKHISIADPRLDATLPNRDRISISLGHESTEGTTFTIRRFKEVPFSPVDLMANQTISPELCAELWTRVQYGESMIICGGTASGKTTTLNAIAMFIPNESKIVSIEDTREINLDHDNWVAAHTRLRKGDSESQTIDMYDLLRDAMRQRPEKVIVGEIRGKEAYALFQAASTGHTTYSTFHADSKETAIHRFEGEPMKIPRNMMPSISTLIFQSQVNVDEQKVRRVKEIIELTGIDPNTEEVLTNDTWKWDPKKDSMEKKTDSKIMDRIKTSMQLDTAGFRGELKRREEYLETMYDEDLTVSTNPENHKVVRRLINEYYLRPETAYEQVVKNKNLNPRTWF